MAYKDVDHKMIVTIGGKTYKVVGGDESDEKQLLHLNRVVEGEVVPYIHRIEPISNLCTITMRGVTRYRVEMMDGTIGFIAAEDIK